MDSYSRGVMSQGLAPHTRMRQAAGVIPAILVLLLSGWPGPVPAQQPSSSAASPTPSVEERLRQANTNLDAAAAVLNGTATPTPAPTAATPVRPPGEALWKEYYSAVAAILGGKPDGHAQFEKLLFSEDVTWLRQNTPHLAELIAPQAARTAPDAAKVAVLQALLRNMPTAPPSQPPLVTFRDKLAVARIVTTGPNGPQVYTTVLAFENGRWVFVQPFFARPFLWMPQLAAYKRARGIPLSGEEQTYAQAGLAPFQKQVQAVYDAVGYKPTPVR